MTSDETREKLREEIEKQFKEVASASFTGPQATHHLTDGEGWRQVNGGHYATLGYLSDELLSRQDLTPQRGSRGRGVKGVIFIGGRCGCGEAISRSEWKKKYRRCVTCRRKTPGVGARKRHEL
jgi:hypothetical protein